MPNKYKDKEGHWTDKENDGGECKHNETKNFISDEDKKMLGVKDKEPNDDVDFDDNEANANEKNVTKGSSFKNDKGVIAKITDDDGKYVTFGFYDENSPLTNKLRDLKTVEKSGLINMLNFNNYKYEEDNTKEKPENFISDEDAKLLGLNKVKDKKK